MSCNVKLEHLNPEILVSITHNILYENYYLYLVKFIQNYY